MPGIAAIIPLGPTTIELSRGVFLIQSLLDWEPEVQWCVVVDDSSHSRGLADLAILSKIRQAVTLENPRRGRGFNWCGGVVDGILAGLDWVYRNTDADFSLIIEPDALVVAPFAERLRVYSRQNPDAGMIGALVINRNRELPFEFQEESALVTAHRLLPPASSDARGRREEDIVVPGVGTFSLERRHSFETVRPLVREAIANGYDANWFLQGGAQVVTKTMTDRMAHAGLLTRSNIWMRLPFFNEPILAMYTSAVGLKSCNCTRREDPFGLRNRGLRYTLQEMTERGHGLIHSVKHDPRYNELEIRRYFQRKVAAVSVDA